MVKTKVIKPVAFKGSLNKTIKIRKIIEMTIKGQFTSERLLENIGRYFIYNNYYCLTSLS